MSDFLKASKMKLRFPTNVGELSMEQLWDIKLTDLDQLAVALEKAYEESKGKSFLSKKSRKDRTIKLQFNVALAILEARVEEQTKASNAQEKRAYNEKILGIIQNKKENELNDMSIEDLEEMLKK